MRFLPVFLDTSSGLVIVVGSGEPARGKLRLLRAAGAHVRWFSREVDIVEEMLTLPGRGRLEISFGDPLKADLSDAVAVVSATGDVLDAQIAARARRHRIPVNVVDRPELSTSYHNNYQDPERFLVAGGRRGRQLQVLVEGTYFINRLFATVERIAKTVIEQAQWKSITGGVVFEVFSFTAVVYVVFTYSMSRLSRRLEYTLGVGTR